ncbi:MAG: stage II sporulation protein M [DPANN group archaeon]|nr:stage II sporulation protein M [DPANN group archaeon]
MSFKSKIKNIVKNCTDSVKEDKYLKIALIILLFAFFLGYSIRVFDFTKSPIMGEIGVIYPIHQEAFPYYMGGVSLESRSMDSSISYDRISESPIDILYVMRNNVISAVLLVSTGVLLGIPTVVFTFLVGLSAGASIAEVLEFAGLIVAAKTIFLLTTYMIAVVLAASIGIEMGSAIIRYLKTNIFEIDKKIYDKAIVVIIIVVINIILQYVLLVM